MKQVNDSKRISVVFIPDFIVKTLKSRGMELIDLETNLITNKDNTLTWLKDNLSKLDIKDWVSVNHMLNSKLLPRQKNKMSVFFSDENNNTFYKFIENDIRFDYLQTKYQDDTLSLMEDYAVQLQLLTRGFKTIQIGSWCFDKASFTGKGGCADERNIERQKNVCEKIKDSFPDFVKIVEAKDETKKDSVKYNIQISWKKLSELSDPIAIEIKDSLDDW